MAGWQDAPIVGSAAPAAPAAPAWQSAPVVSAAPVSQDAPDLAPPAPGIDLSQNGVDATPAAVAPPPPTTAAPQPDLARGVGLTAQAVDKGAIADTLGMPVDLATGATNAGSALVNMGAHVLGNSNDVTGYIQDPAGGSQSISDIAGAAFRALTGHAVASPETMSPDDLSRYRTIEMAANAATTEGFGKIFSELAKLGRAPDVAPPTSPRVQVHAPVDAAPTPASVASAAAAGAGAGAAQQTYDKYGHPIVSAIPVVGPTLDAVLNAATTYGGALGGHVLGKTAVGVGKLASIPARAVAKPFMGSNGGFALQDGTNITPKDLNVAADTYQSAAVDPTKAADAIAANTNTMRANGPITAATGGMSNDPGLISLEQKMRLDPTLAKSFVQNDQQVQTAARGDVDKIAPESAVGRTFTNTADAMQAQKVANAQADLNATKQTINQLDQQRQSEANPIVAAKNTQVQASQALDKAVVDNTLVPMQQKNAAMYAAADPNKTAIVSADPLLDAAQAVHDTLGTFNSPEKVIPSGLLARINGTKPSQELDPEVEAAVSQMSPKAQMQVRAQLAPPEEPATTSIGDIVKSYPELATTEQRARRAGNYTLADNIRTLRNAMDGTIEDAAEHGDTSAQAAMAARQNYKDTIGTTFGDGPGGPATKLRQDFNVDKFQRSESEPSQTAGRFLQPGQPEKADSLKNILANSTDQTVGQHAAGQYLAADLASSGAVKDGVIDPQALANWRSKWGEGTLDTAPQFKTQLDNLQASATTGKAQSNQLAQQLKAHQATLDSAVQNDTAFKNVVGSEPTTAVQSIFQSKDPESAMKEIVGAIGQRSAAHDGLKAAVREYLVERATTSALQKTTTGENPLSFAKVDNLFKQNQGALAQVLSPDEMHSLQVAHTRLKAINNLAQQTLPGSPTAERNGMAKKLWTATEIVLKSTYGGLEGGNKVRNLKLAAAMQGGGPNAVYKTLAEAQFNPELAQVLAKRDVAKPGRKNYDSKLFNSLVLPAAVARNNVDPPQSP